VNIHNSYEVQSLQISQCYTVTQRHKICNRDWSNRGTSSSCSNNSTAGVTQTQTNNKCSRSNNTSKLKYSDRRFAAFHAERSKLSMLCCSANQNSFAKKEQKNLENRRNASPSTDVQKTIVPMNNALKHTTVNIVLWPHISQVRCVTTPRTTIGGGTGGRGNGPPNFSLQGPCCFRPPNWSRK